MLQPGHVLDLYDDAEGVHLRDGKILEKYGSALEIEREADLAKLQDREFAIVLVTKTGEIHRKFPLHTPDQLSISTHYFGKTGAALPQEARVVVASNLAAAHARYGRAVPEDLSKLASKEVVGPYFEMGRGGLVISADDVAPVYAEKYAFVRELGDGSTVEMFPVDTVDQLKASVQEFRKVAFDLSGGDRWRTAKALSEKLAAHGLKDAAIEKLASLDPNPAFMTYVEARMPYLTEENQKTLSSIAALSGGLPGTKIAEALESFDRQAGIAHLWDIRIRNPWSSCFQAKTASVDVGDRSVTERDVLGLLDSGKLDHMFKKATLAEIRRQPLEVFSSLPDPLKHEIASLL